MSTLTEHASEVGAMYAAELRNTRRQLRRLVWHRSTVALSAAEQAEYVRLVTREGVLLRLIG